MRFGVVCGLLAALCTVAMVLPATALRVKPTITALTFDVGKEEVCLYSIGKDFYEGVAMHYHVMAGENDFDVFIRDVDGHVIYASYAGEHGAEDRVYFTTHANKEHAYCIDNRDYSGEPKMIKMEVGLTSLKRWKNRIDPLRKIMTRADGFVMGMHDDQILLRMKEQGIREWVEKIFTMLTVRLVTEAFVVTLIALLNALSITYLFRRASLQGSLTGRPVRK
ncbi:emp24/gp25L/p24_family/GOLD (plasmid) [Leishmania braziliensis MHOM/BR/75/M2904]|nr:emp24/gp25L/p24_family/GOLD [Leishmania braziliensis MHOM/BR/75/M2904]